jgi:[ribosomal protein S18]-alanine N-acetyltransferase
VGAPVRGDGRARVSGRVTEGPGGARLRLAVAADLPALAALEEHFPGDRMSRAALADLLAAARAAIWVAEFEGHVVADAIVAYPPGSGAARLYSLAVDPRYRRRGIAASLLRRAEREARQRGYGAMRLEVRVDNVAARALYEAFGYQLVDTVERFYRDGSAALRLRKHLDAAEASGAAAAECTRDDP